MSDDRRNRRPGSPSRDRNFRPNPRRQRGAADCRRPQAPQPALDRLGRMPPRKMLTNMRTRRRTNTPRPIPIADDLLHQLNKHINIRLKQPRLADGFEPSHDAITQRPALGGNQVRRLTRGIIQHRPRAGDDNRQPARHRLDDRQPEPLAAKRVDQCITRRSKARPSRPRSGCDR